LTEYKKSQIYLKGKNRTDDIDQIKKSDDGQKYHVIFRNGKRYSYNPDNVKIDEPDLEDGIGYDCFKYLQELAKATGIKDKDGNENRNILSNQYSKINSADEDAILNAFLTGKLQNDLQHNDNCDTLNEYEEGVEPIFPFGFNLSQKNAVDKALKNKISIIEGPPGTGKTQTILNIIANAIINDESVAIVSNNNSATKNVIDKLKKYDLDFVAAYLGNRSNKREFINSQKDLQGKNIKSWILEDDEIIEKKEELKINYNILLAKLVKKNQLASLKEKISSLEIEKKHFLQYFQSSKIEFVDQDFEKVRSSKIALEMWLLCEKEKFYSKNLFQLIKFFFEYLKSVRIRYLLHKLLKKYSKSDLIAIFQKKFYELEIFEIKQNIACLTDELSSFDFDKKMNDYINHSLKLFKVKLAKKYSKEDRQIYEIDDLYRKPKKFINDYPIILSTTYSLCSSLSENFKYDYVIIDEASQVDLCSGVLVLSVCKKVVIVGDTKQLQHVCDSKTSDITDDIFKKYNLPEYYRYKNNSILSSIIKSFPEVPRTLLCEHYRCHPKIIGFCNKKFYNGDLITLTEEKTDKEPLIVYKTKKGNHARNRLNQRQIDVIKEEIIPQQKLCTTDGSLGIVTPYRNHTNALQQSFKDLKVKADTVDKFQGQENKVIILSTVDNEISEFADNSNRLNVAVSRAIDQLILVVNDTDSLIDTNIGDLVKYIEYNNFSVVESKVNSIFDYLYECYADSRKKFLQNSKSISKYDSENLMYKLITNIFKEEAINHLGIAFHVPLRTILKDINLLTSDEKNYAFNPLTHIDFLVFNKIDKSPRLAIEVDGVSFHEEGSKQAIRDSLKDDILKKFNIKLFRAKTNGSNERERLIKEFRKII
jgi:superfamily I DNA and/or RNA helicase